MSTTLNCRPNGSDCPECRIGDCFCGGYTHCNEHHVVNESGRCPIGHDGSYCKDCKGPNVFNKCPLGHDGSRCVHCNELNQHKACIHKHTGETCPICNSLMSWVDGTAKCPKHHVGTYCKVCNTAHQFSEDFMSCITNTSYYPPSFSIHLTPLSLYTCINGSFIVLLFI